jgi:hypothetical protein
MILQHAEGPIPLHVCFAVRVQMERWGIIGLVPFLGVALITAACSGSGTDADSPTALARPSSTGHLTIVSPTDGEVITSSDVPVRVKLTGAQVVPASTTNITHDQGHLHLTLDGAIVTMNFGLTDELTGVTPGIHTLQVEFVASDHLPFDPRLIEQVTFEVQK